MKYLVIFLLTVIGPFVTANKAHPVCQSLFYLQLPDQKLKYGSVFDLSQSSEDLLHKAIALGEEIQRDETGKELLLPPTEQFLSDFAQFDKKARYSKIYLSSTGEVLGYLFAKYDNRNDRIHLEKIAVSKSMRGKGLATELLNCLAKRAQERGHNSIELYVLQDNYVAIKFYSHLGFENVSDTDPAKAQKPTFRLMVQASNLESNTQLSMSTH